MKTKIQTTTYETETREQAFAIHFAPRLIYPDAGIFAEMSEAEKWQCIREVRDTLLAACDWTQSVDAPKSDGQKKMWKAYRQSLRDLPQTYHKPEDVLWPEKPE